MSRKKFSDFEYVVDQILKDEEGKAHENRDYQVKLSKEIVSFIEEKKSGELFVATGGGKTKIANDSILEILEDDDKAIFLWVTKDWRLIKQAICSYLNLATNPEGEIETLATYGCPKGVSKLHSQIRNLKRHEYEGQRLIYSCINSIYKDIERFFKDRKIKGIFIDESHHGKTAKMAKEIYAFANRESIPVIGLSATPNIDPGNDCLIGEEVTIEGLIDKGYLVPPTVYLKKVPVDWKPKFREFGKGENKVKILEEESINILCALRGYNQAFLKCLRSPDYDWGRCLVFAGGINHAEHLTSLINQSRNGLKADYIHSKRNSTDIDRVIRAFREGEIDVLVNVEMATTGMDFDFLDTIFLLRPTSSPVLFLQMIGRGTRPFENKDSFNFVDFTYTFAEKEEFLINTLEMLEEYFCNNYRDPDGHSQGESVEEFNELFIDFQNDSALDVYDRLKHEEPTLLIEVLNSLNKVQLIKIIQESNIVDIILEDRDEFETAGISALWKDALVEYINDHVEEWSENECIQEIFVYMENELDVSAFSILARATNSIVNKDGICTLDGAICLNMSMEEMRSYLYYCSKQNEIFNEVVDLLIEEYGYEEILFSGMSFPSFQRRYVEEEIVGEELREAIYRVSQGYNHYLAYDAVA